MAERLALVLLAAGQGRRFGGGKLAAGLAGAPLAHHAARMLAGFAFGAGRFAVVGPGAPGLAGLGYAEIALPDEGAALSRSVAAGVAAAARAGAEGVLLALADMPLVPAAHIAALLAGFAGQAAAGADLRAIATLAEGQRLPPAVLGAGHFPALLALSGDRGAGALLAGAPGVALPAALALDIDTPEDLARAERMLARG